MTIRNHESINGESIRRLRTVVGIKQEVVADKLGVTRQAYSKIERSSNVNMQRVIIILAALNCTIDDLEKIISFTSSRFLG
jgi:transcriptional regulator with XRE-family HTH domain